MTDLLISTECTEDSSSCNSNLLSARDRLRLEQEERSTARLQCWRQRQQEGRRSECTDVKQARLDRQRVHGEESVAFSGSIGVELDSEGSIMSTSTAHSNFEDITSLISSGISDSIPVLARSGSPPQCFTFSSWVDSY